MQRPCCLQEAELLQLLMEVLRASGAASGQGPVEGGQPPGMDLYSFILGLS